MEIELEGWKHLTGKILAKLEELAVAKEGSRVLK